LILYIPDSSGKKDETDKPTDADEGIAVGGGSEGAEKADAQTGR